MKVSACCFINQVDVRLGLAHTSKSRNLATVRADFANNLTCVSVDDISCARSYPVFCGLLSNFSADRFSTLVTDRYSSLAYYCLDFCLESGLACAFQS